MAASGERYTYSWDSPGWVAQWGRSPASGTGTGSGYSHNVRESGTRVEFERVRGCETTTLHLKL